MTKLARCASLALAVLAGVGCAACTSDASSSAPVMATHSSTTADVPPPPKVGQCRNTPPSRLQPDVWVDPTPVVDCSRTHTVETIEVLKPVEKLTLSQVKQLADSCNTEAAGQYLGTSSLPVTRIAYP